MGLERAPGAGEEKVTDEPGAGVLLKGIQSQKREKNAESECKSRSQTNGET